MKTEAMAMRAYIAKPTLVGFSAGLSMAIALSFALSILPPNAALEFVVDLLAGLPVVLVRRLGAPLPLYYSVFFIYSGLTGVAVARLLSRYRVARQISIQ
jgi:hypothetical protein